MLPNRMPATDSSPEFNLMLRARRDIADGYFNIEVKQTHHLSKLSWYPMSTCCIATTVGGAKQCWSARMPRGRSSRFTRHVALESVRYVSYDSCRSLSCTALELDVHWVSVFRDFKDTVFTFLRTILRYLEKFMVSAN